MSIMNDTQSICPECHQVIPAQVIRDDGRLLMRKNCPEHGAFEDSWFGSADVYERFNAYHRNGSGIANPHSPSAQQCPENCGLCGNHLSSTVLANIDITTACNFKCPTCFADASPSTGDGEPTFDQIIRMMDVLAGEDPPCRALQLSGGEPTIRDDLLDICRAAHDRGFKQIQLATNGKVIADTPGFIEKLHRAHVDTLYLQFDGITPEPYIAMRGFNALPLKLKVIEQVRNYGPIPNIVLVPTIARGVNDHQVGDIIRFAVDNIDVIRGVNFQPVAFAGRIDRDDLRTKRITITDLLLAIEEQFGGALRLEDFYPVPVFGRFIDLLRKLQPGLETPELNTHPACGAWTYLFSDRGDILPITRVLDTDRLLRFIEDTRSGSKMALTARLAANLPRLIRRPGFALSGNFLKLLGAMITEGSYKAIARFHSQKMLFIGTMHFMDAYNFDLERLQRCCIHYALPDGRVVPFCAYNTLYR